MGQHNRRRFRLSKLKFDEVSLVRSGDDPEALVVLAKAAPTLDIDETDLLDDEDRALIEKCLISKGILERNPGPDDNWIERMGGLPAYIEEVAEAIHGDGKPVSTSIAIAINRIKHWATGAGVDEDTQAKATAALAQWEAMKAANKGDAADVSKADLPADIAGPTLPVEMTTIPEARMSDTPADAIVKSDEDLDELAEESADATSTDVPADEAPELEPEVEKDAEDEAPADETDTPDSNDTEAAAPADMPAEVVAYVEALEDEADALRAELDAAQARIVELENAEPAGEPVEVEKSAEDIEIETLAEAIEKADPAIRIVLEKAHAEAVTAKEQAAEAIAKAAAIEEEQTQREYIAKAADFDGLGQDETTVAKALRAVDTLEPEQAEVIKSMLAAGRAQSSLTGLTTEVGHNSVEPVSKSADALAEEIRKQNPDMSIEAARAEVYKKHPDIYSAAMAGEEI